jgi:hypothetical protein
MNILILNKFKFHYETIESIIQYIDKILSIQNFNIEKIKNIHLKIVPNPSFESYIKNKYPQLITKIFYLNYLTPHKFYNYIINCTIYPRDFKIIKNKNKNKYFYICHETGIPKQKNIFFLTPLCKTSNYIYLDKLPFQNQNSPFNSDLPIYAIQGNIDAHRRNYNLLIKILENKYNYDFRIKLIGRGQIPIQLKKFSDKIILKNNLNFIDYHKEFLDVYCILPLILKKTHKQYYINKLTSTINYAKAYNLKCIIDDDLQKIYNLENAEVFYNENDIVKVFEKTLNDFYNQKLSICKN